MGIQAAVLRRVGRPIAELLIGSVGPLWYPT
jgi:hypothetical protein